MLVRVLQRIYVNIYVYREYICSIYIIIYILYIYIYTHRHTLYIYILCFPGGSVGKESTCNAGDVGEVGSVPELG